MGRAFEGRAGWRFLQTNDLPDSHSGHLERPGFPVSSGHHPPTFPRRCTGPHPLPATYSPSSLTAGAGVPGRCCCRGRGGARWAGRTGRREATVAPGASSPLQSTQPRGAPSPRGRGQTVGCTNEGGGCGRGTGPG